MFKVAICALTLLAAAAIARPAAADECTYDASGVGWEKVEPGLSYGKHVAAKPKKGVPKLYAHLLRVTLGKSGLTLRALRVRGKSLLVEKVARAFEADGLDLRAAVNGDYFSFVTAGHPPFGMHASAGQLLWSPAGTSTLAIDHRNAAHIAIFTIGQTLTLKRSGAQIAITRVNRKPGRKGAALFHGDYSTKTPRAHGCTFLALAGNKRRPMIGHVLELKLARVEPAKPFGLAPGQLGVIACGKAGKAAAAWRLGDAVRLDTRTHGKSRRLMEAISGGPRVLRAGKLIDEMSTEGFSRLQRFYLPKRHPRTAIGVSRDGGTVYLLVAEGRTKRSDGVGASDAACILRDVGAHDAMLVDGGGSATMYLGGKLMNVPFLKSKRTWRNVANILGVVRGKAK